MGSYSSSELLIEMEIPAAALSGRTLVIDRTTKHGRELLAVAGNDRLSDASGRIINFGSHDQWRDEFNSIFRSNQAKNNLYYNLERSTRRFEKQGKRKRA